MKKLVLTAASVVLLTGAASAADLPRRAPPPVLVPAPAFSWTGIYIGTHTTYVFTDKQRITTTANDPFGAAVIAAGIVPGAVSAQQSRLAQLGGGFGADYQLTPGSGFVVGAVFNADWTDLHKNAVVIGNPTLAPFLGSPAGVRIGNVSNQGLGFLATANGRFGYAFDRFLAYATGGVAIGKVDYAASGYLPTGQLVFTGSYGGHEIGYNYGGGVEYAIPTDSLLGRFDLLELVGIKIGGTSTLKVEYLRYDLGSRNVLVSDTVGIGTSSTARFRTEGSLVRAGFTYRFGG